MATLRNLAAARDALGLDLATLQSRTGFYWAYARNLERGRTRAGADTVWGRLANPAQDVCKLQSITVLRRLRSRADVRKYHYASPSMR
jgi:hypothetical protein